MARMAAWHSTPDGRLIWSPEVYDLLKMRQGDFDGTIENFLEFVHDSDRERVMQEAARAWNELSRYEVIYRLYDGEGNLFDTLTGGYTPSLRAGKDVPTPEQVEMYTMGSQEAIANRIGKVRRATELQKLHTANIAIEQAFEAFPSLSANPNRLLDESVRNKLIQENPEGSEILQAAFEGATLFDSLKKKSLEWSVFL